MRFASDVYVYEWTNMYDNNCNSFYIGGDVKCLIDPGLNRYLPDLFAQMADDGIDKGDIRYVINTHSHPDHYEGSTWFSSKDVRIGLHEDEIAFMGGVGGELYGLFGLDIPKVNVDLILKAGKIKLGPEEFQIIHIPGHSPGSIGLYWSKQEFLFCGDVVFEQNVGRTDFPGGDGRLLKDSIMRLSDLDVEACFPGHMGIIDGKDEVKRNFQMIIKHVFPYI
ncbi:MAG: MBL fold metallo-hydrolase [Smithellaceae bacterium]|nr:MBL fold metallo-hydrolase [Smithellaceae bacterium]